jgi:DNA repair exonuclease SbcCD nuclease subunit
MEKDEFHVIHFSDLHIGHKHVNESHVNFLLDTISAFTLLNPNSMIVFTGDLFHTKVSVDSVHTQLAIKLLNKLDTLNVPCIFINGTRSHDHNYIQTFLDINYRNIIFVEQTTVLELDDALRFCNFSKKNLSIYAIPEEYLDDEEQNEVYAPLLNSASEDFYDMVLYHGTVSDVAVYNEFIEAVPFKKAPSFSTKQFFKISNNIFAGHIHKKHLKVINNKTFCYAGSTTRMNHGEEEPKGFFIHTLKEDSETKQLYTHKSTFIENIYANIFITAVLHKVNNDPNSLVYKFFYQNSKELIGEFDFNSETEIEKFKNIIPRNINFRILVTNGKNPLVVKILSSLDNENPLLMIQYKNTNTNDYTLLPDDSEEAKKEVLEEINQYKSCSSVFEAVSIYLKKEKDIEIDPSDIKRIIDVNEVEELT